MMALFRNVLILLVMLSPAVLRAQTTQPGQPSGEDLEKMRLRADQAFAAGEYGVALPLFKLIEPGVTDPDARESLGERIRVCQRMLELGAGRVQGSMSDTPRIPHEPPDPEGVAEFTIKELGNFDYDSIKGGNIPPDVSRLNGSQVRLRGYMIPLEQADKMTLFALVPSLFDCCFGQPPQVHHVITIRCPEGKGITYYPEELVTEGTLKVEEIKGDGMILSLFELDARSIRPADQ